ncbi:MAG: sigma factor [Thermoanaerobaculia bacterium]|nr:sigma factor [Thermoanaerobaculia bacterium]
MDRHGRTVRKGVFRGLGRIGLEPRPDRVDDLVQETYCRLLERERRGRPIPTEEEGPAASFLYRTTWSVVVDHVRRNRATKRGGGRTVCSSVGRGGECLLDRRGDSGPDPEERLLAREEAARVRDRIRASVRTRRPQRDRKIVEMTILEGRSAREVQDVLDGDLTISGIHSVVHRVRRTMIEDGSGDGG